MTRVPCLCSGSQAGLHSVSPVLPLSQAWLFVTRAQRGWQRQRADCVRGNKLALLLSVKPARRSMARRGFHGSLSVLRRWAGGIRRGRRSPSSSRWWMPTRSGTGKHSGAKRGPRGSAPRGLDGKPNCRDDVAMNRPGFLNPDGTPRKPWRIYNFQHAEPDGTRDGTRLPCRKL